MNYKMRGVILLTSILFVSCGSVNIDSNNDSTTSVDTTVDTTTDIAAIERFTLVTINGDTLEKDNETRLEWVGSAGADGEACQANGTADDEVGAVASADSHCFALVFAGYNDWRAPTASEQSEMIIEMNAAGKTPFYTVPTCPRLMGVDGSTATAVNTHNSDPVGALIPWSTLLQLSTTNYGVKCVRNF